MSRRPALIAVHLALLLCAPSAIAGPQDFEVATQLYRQGRWSAAYGSFVRLANAGDPDAARIALFMHRYGPQLYGSYWDAQPDDKSDWIRLAGTDKGRAAPPFQPIQYPEPPSRRKGPRSTAALR